LALPFYPLPKSSYQKQWAHKKLGVGKGFAFAVLSPFIPLGLRASKKTTTYWGWHWLIRAFPIVPNPIPPNFPKKLHE
jgi:hypothetical protein